MQPEAVSLYAEVIWRELYQTHCRDTFATDLAFRSRCIPTKCHRWRCRLIPCVQGALGDFLESPCPNADWPHVLQCRGVPYSELGLELGFRANQDEWCWTMHRNNLSPAGLEPAQLGFVLIGPSAMWATPSGHHHNFDVMWHFGIKALQHCYCTGCTIKIQSLHI